MPARLNSKQAEAWLQVDGNWERLQLDLTESDLDGGSA